MTALIDLDSILYKSVYKIVSVSQIRQAFATYETKEEVRQWFLEEVYNEGINRCENEILKTIEYLQSVMIEEITGFELFITTCSKSFRKELSKTYKSNRKKNNYVWMLREHYRNNDAQHDEVLEADDLISLRAKELGIGNYVIVSMDKDLKQIGGYYWSYYKQRSKDFDGNTIEDEFGRPVMEYKQKEVQYITPEEANKLLWMQMLTGDTSDNIKGLHRVGPKKAEKILQDSKCLWVTVAREYIKRDQKEDFKINYQLLKLK